MFVSEPMTPEQLEALALTTYIDDLSRRVERREYEEDSADPVPRPPSPPPEYDRFGKRTNTREHRIIRELEVERTLAVYHALELIPGYIPPPSLTKLTRSTEKFYLPVRLYPEINFVGLLLGPRGNNLRHMEAESGAKISIRGRGSVKEGSSSATQAGNEEELHCVVTAISLESIHMAFKLIQTVVDTAVQTPEHQNDFKRLQLRELAELNGTLRNHENQLCSYCRQPGHRKFACLVRKGDLQRQGADTPKVSSPLDDNSAAVEEFLNDIEYSNPQEQTSDNTPGFSDNRDDGNDAAERRNGLLKTETPASINSVLEEAGFNPNEQTTNESHSPSQTQPPASTGLPAPPGTTAVAEGSTDLPPPPGVSESNLIAGAPLAPPPTFMLPPPPQVKNPGQKG